MEKNFSHELTNEEYLTAKLSGLFLHRPWRFVVESGSERLQTRAESIELDDSLVKLFQFCNSADLGQWRNRVEINSDNSFLIIDWSRDGYEELSENDVDLLEKIFDDAKLSFEEDEDSETG